jgi:hypothetical protein
LVIGCDHIEIHFAGCAQTAGHAGRMISQASVPKPAFGAGINVICCLEPAMLTQLDDSLQPLIDAFNQSASKRRFVTLLSPT